MNKESMIEDKEHVMSLGTKLSSLRKKMGLSENDIAERLHIRKAVILNIENDMQDNAPTVFLKGYIRSYATIVGLDRSEYEPYLSSLINQQSAQPMKNYSYKEQNKRYGKRIFLISLILLMAIIGVSLFLVWQDDKNNFIEVSHYISPTPSSSIVNS